MTLRDQLQQSLGSSYTLERELGGGGMSRVFLAEDKTLGRKIVVKVLPPELTAGVNVERFNREILLAAKLQHPHIVPVHSAGEMDGLPWFTMPFVEGESLRERLGRGPLGITELVSLLRDVAKALAYAHERGIVHRDIKPDNILITGGSATVADFGIAKAISVSRTQGSSETLTQVGTSIGTPTYMSPEQAAGDPDTDHRADIYSFGCVAYELLAGRPPFVEATARRLLTAHMAEKPRAVSELRPDTPAALADLVMRCLEKDAEARPQRASDLVRVLDTVTTGNGTQPVAPTLLAGNASMLGKSLGLYALAFAAVAILARAAIVGIGLPEWVFPSALVVMFLGLPVILWTAYVHRVARKAFATTPTLTPGGTPQLVKGTMATMALKASPHVSWKRTARGGLISMGVFVVLVGAFMVLRALGIGPSASLFAAGTLSERDRLLMTDFAVSGADSSLGRVVSDAVRAGLLQSDVLTLMSPTEIAAALQRMERPVTSRIDLALARNMGSREGVKAIIDGDVTQVGTSYIVAVRLVTTDSGKELTSYRATGDGTEGIIAVADELSRKLRAKAGESLRAVNGAPPLAQVTTGSLEALRKYSEGNRANSENNYPKATRLLREAVAIDTLFAEAWRMLGVSMGNLGMPASEREPVLTRAFQLRDRLGERDRLRMIATYYWSGPGRDRAKAIEADERLLARGDSDVVLNNMTVALRSRREFARAESLARATVRGTPPSALRSSALISTLYVQGKWGEVDSMIAVGRARFPGNTLFNEWSLYRLLSLGETESYRQGVDSARRVTDARNPSGATKSAAALASSEGRIAELRSFLAQAWRIDSTAGVNFPPIVRMATALDQRSKEQLPFDDVLKAYEDQLKKTPLSSLPAADVPYLDIAGFFARAGRVERARAAMVEYDNLVTDTSLRRSQQPALHAALGEIASAEGKWEVAVREMRKSDSLPDGPANICAHCLSLNLLRLFAHAGMADSALAQYAVYLKTPQGSRPRKGPDYFVSASTLEAVARMYEQRGDTAQAVQAYQDFTEMWKRADPELQPRVTAARKRIEALTPVERPRR